MVLWQDIRYWVFGQNAMMVLTTKWTPLKWRFKIAGSMAFKEAMRKGGATLLEPVMKVDVTVPEEYMGDIIGDINSRRGRIEGMDSRNGASIVHGYVPLGEMFGYATESTF